LVDWKRPPTEVLHDAQADAALADQHAEEGRVAAAHSATGVAYEKLDVNPTSIVRLGITLVAGSIGAAALSYGLFFLFRSREARSEPPRPPLAIREVGRIPPEPRLQTTPLSDLARVRAQQAAELQRYGWVDRAAGKVRIPIEDAMRIYAERQSARGGAAAAAGTATGTETATAPTATGTGPAMGTESPRAPADASAPYPPGSSAAWPGSPTSAMPAGQSGRERPEGPPASPFPAAVATPPPGGHE